MGWNFIGLGGGSGAGFQLFKKSTDGEDAIFANAAARDSYFTANPGDLTILDEDQFKIIKLLDNGSGEVAYQQRQSNTWVDVTSLVQGEQGPAGATGNSYFFSSIAARDAFFSDPPNEGLLEEGLPTCVNVGGETVSNYIWNGESSPTSYDPSNWVISSIQVSSGTVFLGQAGAALSSGNEVLSFKSADGLTKRYMVGIVFDNTGSQVPVYWRLGPLSNNVLSTLFSQTLADPQDLQYQFTSDSMLVNFTLRPATVGELRIQMHLGSDATGPQLIDAFFEVTAPDIGNQITYTFPNDNLITNGTDVYVSFSGIQLFGDLQTSGPFTGQTVPALVYGGHLGSELFFSSTDSDLLSGEVPFGIGTSTTTSEAVFKWDTLNKRLGVNESSPDTTLHVNSQDANTESLIKLQNNDGEVESFLINGSPEGVVTSGLGSLAQDVNNGTLWIKETATGNTGWIDLVSGSGGSVVGPASSVDNELTIYDGTTGKLIKGGTQILGVPGDAALLQLYTTLIGSNPKIAFFDQTSTERASIEYEPTDDELLIYAVNDLVVSSDNDATFSVFGGGKAAIQSTTGEVELRGANLSLVSQSAGIVVNSATTYGLTADTGITLTSTTDSITLTANNTVLIQGSSNFVALQAPDGILALSDDAVNSDASTVIRGTSSGANGETVYQYVGDRDPEGNITALPGSIYFRIDGTDSNIYQLHSSGPTVANTPWVPIAQGSGDVIGPASSIDNELVIFDGTTGKLIQGGTNITSSGGASGILNMGTTDNSVYPTINFLNSTSAIIGYIDFEPDNLDMNISSSGTFSIEAVNAIEIGSSSSSVTISADNSLLIEAGAAFVALDAPNGIFISSSDTVASDNSTILRAASSGVNGETIYQYVGDRDPEGNITALPGSIYFRIDGTNSNLYQLHSSGPTTANTPWVPIAQGSGDVIGPASSIDNELVLFDGTTGKLIQGGSNVTASGGASAILNLGTTDNSVYPTINFLNSASAIAGYIDYEPDNSELNISSSGAFLVEAAGNSGITVANGNISIVNTGTGGLTLTGTQFLDISCGTTATFTAASTLALESTGSGTTLITNNGLTITSNDTGSADSALLLQIGSVGTNSGAVAQYVGSQNPEGVINGLPGDIYWRTDGSDSNIYQLHSTGPGETNTPWVPIAQGSGDVIGPSSSVDNELVIFDGTTGKLIQGGTNITSDTGAAGVLNIGTTANTSFPTINFLNAASSTVGYIDYEPNNNNLNINSNGSFDITSNAASTIVVDGGLTIQSTDDNLLIEGTVVGTINIGVNGSVNAGDNLNLTAGAGLVGISGASGSAVVATNTLTSDATRAFLIGSSGANGEAVGQYVGNRDPEGNINALPGSIYFRIDGTNSNIYQLHSTGPGAATTPWVPIAQGSGDVIGPSSSVDNSMVVFDGATGKLIQDNTHIIAPPGTRALIQLTGDTASDYGTIDFLDTGASTAGRIEFEEDDGSFNIWAFNNDLNVIADNAATFGSDFGNASLTASSGVASVSGNSVNLTSQNGNITLNSQTDDTQVNGANINLTSTAGTVDLTAETAINLSSNTLGNTDPLLGIFNSGANAGVTLWMTGSQDPLNNVNGNTFRLYHYNGIGNLEADVFINDSAGTNVNNWVGMKGGAAILTWGDSNVNTTTTIRYLSPGYDQGAATTTPVQLRIPRRGLFRKMYVTHTTPAGNGNNITYTLRVNGIATTSVTLASTASNAANTGASFNVSANALIDIEVTKPQGAIGTSPTGIMVTLEFY